VLNYLSKTNQVSFLGTYNESIWSSKKDGQKGWYVTLLRTNAILANLEFELGQDLN
jgi:hypothetical protein